jgi:hypothetical protein
MQDRRAVRIQRAFRIAGRAGRVAQAGGRALVELRPRIVVALRADQVFIAQQRVDARITWERCAVAQGHPGLDARAGARQRGDNRQEGQVEEQHLVVGVVDDVGDLFRVQAGIDRVQHGAGARDAVIQFEVPVAVPGQRGHPVAHGDAQAVQRIGQLARAGGRIAPGVAVQVALDAARDDFAIAVVARGEFDDAGDQQRCIHHLALQGTHRVIRHVGSGIVGS